MDSLTNAFQGVANTALSAFDIFVKGKTEQAKANAAATTTIGQTEQIKTAGEVALMQRAQLIKGATTAALLLGVVWLITRSD